VRRIVDEDVDTAEFGKRLFDDLAAVNRVLDEPAKRTSGNPSRTSASSLTNALLIPALK
jgi:hypothetical protein